VARIKSTAQRKFAELLGEGKIDQEKSKRHARC
jgi:hypothetical protein